MNVKWVLAGGLALVVLVLVLVFSGAPQRVIATNALRPSAEIAHLPGGAELCQAGETLPRDTTAIRMDLETTVGPRVAVAVLSDGRVLTGGTHAAAWTGADLVVPVAPLRRSARMVTLCVELGEGRQMVSALGESNRGPSALARGAFQQPLGRMHVDYLGSGRRSWWAMAVTIARRMGLGRVPSGTVVVLLIAALMLSASALAVGLATRELGGRRVPRAAWVCAAVAFLNAACWSLLSPPFQTTDEPSHFAYVQYLAETGRLPTHEGYGFSPQQQVALEDLHQTNVAFMPSARTIATAAEQRKLSRDLSRPLSRVGTGEVGTAVNEPPLYYAAQVIPYELGAPWGLLGRLELMRLLSCALGGLAALFMFLFVRETLPGLPWAWTVGGLGVALAPLLGFMLGAVNPEAGLTAAAAALFYLLARCLHRGLTPKLAAALGAVVAAGVLMKLNFLGLVPGALLGLLVVTLRGLPTLRRRVAVAGLALILAAGPVVVYLALKPSTSIGPLELVSRSTTHATEDDLAAQLSYIWQLFLPRLPGMVTYFPGIFTPRALWLDGFVGLYGWADTVFPGWVYTVALVPVVLLGLLCLRGLAASRARLLKRIPELVVYASMAIGLLALVGAASYRSDVVVHEGPFWEPRYLLALFPLLAVALALAARGAGRRWGPAVGMAIVVLVLAHDLFSQLLVISRYYS